MHSCMHACMHVRMYSCRHSLLPLPQRRRTRHEPSPLCLQHGPTLALTPTLAHPALYPGPHSHPRSFSPVPWPSLPPSLIQPCTLALTPTLAHPALYPRPPSPLTLTLTGPRPAPSPALISSPRLWPGLPPPQSGTHAYVNAYTHAHSSPWLWPVLPVRPSRPPMEACCSPI